MNRVVGLFVLGYFVGIPSYVFLVVVLAGLRWVTYSQIPWHMVFVLPLLVVVALWLFLLTLWLLGKLFEKAGKRDV